MRPMSRGRYIPPVDPSVGPVEDLLDAAASRTTGATERRAGRVVASHALWLCACETFDDAPTWLIYAVGADGVGWQRIPEQVDIEDVVDAEHLTGCHPDPEGVLVWLRGERPRPWRRGLGDFPEDSHVYDELQRRILSV